MKRLLLSIKNNIPNAITCTNLLCGALAIVFAFRPFDMVTTHLAGYQMAFVMIALAAVADFADGFVARLIHAVSPLGKELDSLSDCVSFGLAPAMILLNIMHVARPDGWLCYTTLLIPVFGALRLARFNIDTTQSTTFKGLPIPANALFFIGLCQWYASHHTVSQWILVVFVVAFSLLMVCNLRMFSLKLHSLSPKENFRQYLLVAATVAFIALGGVEGLAWTILFYVILSAAAPVKQ